MAYKTYQCPVCHKNKSVRQMDHEDSVVFCYKCKRIMNPLQLNRKVERMEKSAEKH